MSGQLGGRSAAVGVAPKQLCGRAVLGALDYAEVVLGVVLDEHHADVAAVSLVPAEAVHICGRFHHALYKGRVKNVFHFLFTKTFFSYSLISSR